MTKQVSYEEYAELMRTAFSHLHDPADWKASIDVIVPYNAANVYMESIKFMTATEVGCERTQDAVGNPAFRLYSVGYRMGPAGP